MITLVTWRGKTQTVTAWARELGINYRTLAARLHKSSEPLDVVMTRPVDWNRRMLTHNGKTQCVADWARELGLDNTTLHSRLAKGWPVEKALSPVKRGPAQYTNDGRTQTLEAWAKECGVALTTLRRRIRQGMPLAKALTIPSPGARIITEESWAEEIAQRREHVKPVRKPSLRHALTFDGRTQTIKAWREELGIPQSQWSTMRSCGIAPADILAEFAKDRPKASQAPGVGQDFAPYAEDRRGQRSARLDPFGNFVNQDTP